MDNAELLKACQIMCGKEDRTYLGRSYEQNLNLVIKSAKNAREKIQKM